MRYMAFISMPEAETPPPQALVEAMGEHVQKSFAEGTLVDTGGLYGPDAWTEVRLAGGTVTTTDGPFAEATEVVGGYAIIEVRDHAEAVEQAQRMIAIHAEHWPEWSGSCTVRRIAGPDEGPPTRD